MIRAAIISAALAVAVISAAQIPASAQTNTVDNATSQRLTDYLRKHRLPLVGAQITRDDSGGTQVMLYGYVATSFGKSDAETKTRSFMKPGAQIVNRIQIRPEILHLKRKTTDTGP
jgi:opacity protein-like surface antigen